MSSKRFLYIVIATFITVLGWAVFDIIHTRSKVQTPPEVKELLTPIEPTFDQDAINSL